MEARMKDAYYSPKGYWKGKAAINKLSKAAKVTEAEALDFLKKQDVWQVYLPAPKKIVRPKFEAEEKNAVHQADLLFLPHDKVGKKLYKYALTVVDVGSRYKDAEPLTSKDSKEVASAFENIYKRVLKFPKTLQVDPGREFMGAVSILMAKHHASIRRGRKDIHRDQAIVERFNKTLGERLFAYQYDKEMEHPEKRNREWVKRLSGVVKAINVDYKKPRDIPESASETTTDIPPFVKVRYLYLPGELEGGTRKRATDPIWSVDKHEIAKKFTMQGIDVYYLHPPAPQRGFVREELLFVD